MKKQDITITLNNEDIELLNELLSMNEYEFYKENKIKKSELCKDLLDKINK